MRKDVQWMSGVYVLTFVAKPNIIYVGSTNRNFHNRYSAHLKALKKNKHSNDLLQNAYDIYGDFEMKVIEVCDKSAKKAEKKWIKWFKSKPVFELCNKTKNTPGGQIQRKRNISVIKTETSVYSSNDPIRLILSLKFCPNAELLKSGLNQNEADELVYVTRKAMGLKVDEFPISPARECIYPA